MRSFIALLLFASSALAIWPLPVSYSNGSDVLWIDQNVKISYNGGGSVSGRVPRLDLQN
jgi:hexosaminidase